MTYTMFAVALVVVVAIAFALRRVRQQLSAHTTAINETRLKVAKLERGE